MLEPALHHAFLFRVRKSGAARFSSLLQDLPVVSNLWITASAAQLFCGLPWVQSSGFWHTRAVWSLNSAYSGAYLLLAGVKMQQPNTQMEMCVIYSSFTAVWGFLRRKTNAGHLARKNTLLSILSLLVSHQAQRNCFAFYHFRFYQIYSRNGFGARTNGRIHS